MSAHEVMEWSAYEQVYGSLLVHERIDFGLARIAFMLSDGSKPFRTFAPQWYQDLTAEAALMSGMSALRGMEGVESADD